MSEKEDNKNQAPSADITPGSIVSGKITNITNFGAFVKLENGEEGLIHISEIAYEYVKDINEFVTVGADVQVKILKRNVKNKLELSLKQTKEKNKEALFIQKKTNNTDFEDKISSFMKRSEEKQIDIRRNLKHKQGLVKRKH